MTDSSRTNEVKDFYNQVGWQRISDELYQNAIYEDLRPVSREYIERCHLRVNRHLIRKGKYLLDAGSGPVQWPAYLTYSEGYLTECAWIYPWSPCRKPATAWGQKVYMSSETYRRLPFKNGVFGSTVSMHTLHHLSSEDQMKAYEEMFRTLEGKGRMVVVNGSSSSPLMARWLWLVKMAERLGVKTSVEAATVKTSATQPVKKNNLEKEARGTFTRKNSIQWINDRTQRLCLPTSTLAQHKCTFYAGVDSPLVGRKILVAVVVLARREGSPLVC